ncbi:hypothetical protein VKT23_011754 [Stygiomarasmius scandens]|uniref:Uncharacterized protein n=1 Tax=Marasmiellus scandens TaxID=2682957 RepID=A0ABR1J7Z0_9AGAR
MFSKALVLAPLAVCIVSSVNAAPAEEKRQLDGVSIPSDIPTDVLTSLLGGTGVPDINQITSALGTAIPSDAIDSLTSALATASIPDIGSALPTALPSDVGAALSSILPSGVDVGALTSLLPSGVAIPTDAAQLSSLLGSESITDAGQLSSILAPASQSTGTDNTQGGNTDTNGDSNGGSGDNGAALGLTSPSYMLATVLGGSLLGAFMTL